VIGLAFQINFFETESLGQESRKSRHAALVGLSDPKRSISSLNRPQVAFGRPLHHRIGVWGHQTLAAKREGAIKSRLISGL
jgi:hypothetical protein